MRKSSMLTLILLSVLFVSSSVWSQESWNVAQRTMTPLSWGEVSRATVRGDYAYIASGRSGLRILDIRNPAEPVEVGYCDTPGNAQGVAVLGNYAYVADLMCDLRVIDVSSPTNPHEIAWLEAGSMIYDVDCDDQYVYVIDRWGGLKVVDVSNPYQPAVLGTCLSTMSNVISLEVMGDYAYVGDQVEGLTIIDITVPGNPSVVGSISMQSIPMGICISSHYAYVIAGGLRILDVSEPRAPFQVSMTSIASGARDVVAFSDYVAMPTYSGSLDVYDVSTPSAPFEIARCSINETGKDIVLFGDYAGVVDDGFTIIDVSTPFSPEVVSGYYSMGRNERVCVSRDYIYVAAGCDGLKIVEITPSGLLEVVSQVETYHAHEVAIYGDYIYVADDAFGLQVVDVSDPESPFICGVCNTSGITKAVDVSRDYAYLADSNGGFRIVDISEPGSPYEVAVCETNGSVIDVEVQDNYAYVIDNSLLVFDISNPQNPYQVASYSGVETYNGIAVSGTYAVVTYLLDADGVFGFKVIDISDPMNPVLLGNTVTPGGEYAYSLEIAGDYVYLANGIAGLQVYNVSDPSIPALEGYYSPSYTESTALDVVGGRVYMVDKNFLRVLDFLPVTNVEPSSPAQVPIDFTMSAAYPNPFNPTTTVMIGLPQAGRLEVNVYNVLGQEIAVLANNYYSQGYHRFTYDADGLASGIYFIRAGISGDEYQLRKVVLMR